MSKNKDMNTGAQGAPIQNTLPERILINENLMYFSGIEQDAIKLISKANKLAEKYEELEIGPFTQEVFNQLVLNGYAIAKDEYSKMILSETKSITLRNLLQNDVDRVFKDLQVFIDDVKKRNVFGNTVVS
jgi:hypothetical protein